MEEVLLPLLGDKGHQNMIDFIRKVTPTLIKPSAILVISAHWKRVNQPLQMEHFLIDL